MVDEGLPYRTVMPVEAADRGRAAPCPRQNSAPTTMARQAASQVSLTHSSASRPSSRMFRAMAAQ